MPTQSPPLKRGERGWKAATFVIFVGTGITYASWVTRTPAIRSSLGVGTGDMGLIILGLSIGSMAGLLLAGPVVARIGARHVIAAAATVASLGLFTVGLGSGVAIAALVGLGLAFTGAGFGMCEVALNVEGAAIEKRMGRSFLPSLHGAFSLGTLAGAGLGAVAELLDVPVPVHLGVLAVVVLVSSVSVVALLPPATGREAGRTRRRSGTSGGPTIWRDTRIVLLGLIALGMAFAEGSANDWLPLGIVDGYGVGSATGAAFYVVFVAAMTSGRLLGGRVVDRYGRSATVRWSAALAVAGVLIVILAGNLVLAALGCALWGVGVALGFPLALSAAADSGADAARRVSAVSTLGYMAFLVGPPLLGLLGEQFGLLQAFYVVLAGAVLAGLVASAAGETRETEDFPLAEEWIGSK
ncbi:major facilitator superfamily transporter [Rhodococcus opacus PD630]|uniref:MFS transporter n=1 Tax=Rhodococcus opacus TaxID=37919 RepID=UPI00029CD4FB|nr:MFS transporter [Rhodococcus opacus]AHK28246.1 Inner membrane protein ybjJ [Rhodococcus opacus PD630]EHI44687.1 major facilitator superfamily transporter [Rhodococcus opacus PD630]RZK81918.1 MAG: MFS transporter [Rhodococcus sp. (in: high G+C Gram-positive bacteria)]UDG98152.1 MFS transporter [Rhodococcus opacus PD630]